MLVSLISRLEGQRLIEVLRRWINNVDDPPPSWPVVVRALRSNFVNAVGLAEEVRKKHCPEYGEPESYIFIAQPSIEKDN